MRWSASGPGSMTCNTVPSQRMLLGQDAVHDRRGALPAPDTANAGFITISGPIYSCSRLPSGKALRPEADWQQPNNRKRV